MITTKPQSGARELGAFKGRPEPPRGIRATPESMEATIVWNAPADQRGIIGYRVFQSKESNLVSGNLDKNVRQFKIKMPANATDMCYVSALSALGRESPKIPVVVTSDTDKYVRAGAVQGETSGTSAAPAPEWTYEPGGGFSWGGYRSW